MNAKIFLFHMTVVGLLAGRTGAQSMACMNAEPGEKKQCYYDRDLQLTQMPTNLEVLMPRYESYETFFTIMDPHTYCSDLESYREAAICSLNVSRDCFDPDGTMQMVTESESMVAGMERLCQLKDQVDSACFKTFFNAASDCTDYNMFLLDINPLTSSDKDMVCLPNDLLYDCMELLLKPLCRENTTNIYLEQVGLYQIAPLCKNGSEPTRPRRRYFQELVQEVDDEVDFSSAVAISTVTTTTIFIISIIAVMAGRLLMC